MKFRMFFMLWRVYAAAACVMLVLRRKAGYRSTLGEVIVIDPQGFGHRFDPLEGKTTEDELSSAAAHLLFQPDEGEGKIFTQRATCMLTQLFLAGRIEGKAPFPYVRPKFQRNVKIL